MLTHRDIIPFAVAAMAAVSMGVGAGLFIALPDYFAERTTQIEPEISAVDPNLAKYEQMLAEQGIKALPPTLETEWRRVVAPTEESTSVRVAELQATFAQDEEAFQADAKARRAEQIAWYNDQRAMFQGQPPAFSGRGGPDELMSFSSGEPHRESDRYEATDEPLTSPSS
jgi:hypothetical protein